MPETCQKGVKRPFSIVSHGSISVKCLAKNRPYGRKREKWSLYTKIAKMRKKHCNGEENVI